MPESWNGKGKNVLRYLAIIGVLMALIAPPACLYGAEVARTTPAVDNGMTQDELEAHLKPYFEAVVAAIYKAEGGAIAKKPYGVLSVPCKDKADCGRVCLNTVRNNYWRWVKAGKSGDFITYLGARYCPVGANNDNGTNKFWVSNVEALL